jgi:hypothetical protein
MKPVITEKKDEAENLAPGRFVDHLAAAVALNLRCFRVGLGEYPLKSQN